MLFAYCLFLLSLPSNNAKVFLEDYSNENLVTCISEIIFNYYKKNRVTYLDGNYDSDAVIKTIHSKHISAISRGTGKNLQVVNFQYIVAAGTAADFTRYFPILAEELRWNPYALFLIIVKSLNTADLKRIFDVLLKYHVNDVLLVNGTDDADLYTYNPFDNYNCGKKYDEIIEFGRCKRPRVSDLYPEKLVTGIRNCTFNATLSHWPPFTIDRNMSKDSIMGAEQYVLKIISEMEHFDVKYTRSINGEDFSTIGDNMTVSGDLFMLQDERTDIMFGGMFLTHYRARVFDSINGHLPNMDNIRIFIQKASLVPSWKNICLEFHPTVWLVLGICFVGYFIFVLTILRVKDKTSLLLIMFDLLLLHGSNMIFKSKGVFIVWILFAYLISAFYQSSLVSIMAHPIKEYQISNDEDLTYYNIEPCISLGLQVYLREVETDTGEFVSKSGCMTVLESIQSASRSNKLYAVALESIYLYNRHLFYDERGEDSVYIFKPPMSSIIYAIYLYKGFPLYNKLNLHTIRFREHGFVDRYLHLVYEDRLRRLKKYNHVPGKRYQIIVPWYILLVGSILASGLFLLEILSKKKPRTIQVHA